ncbi:MAG: hypothetical protein ABI867_23260 [Kofleriaceae bacterium]
MPPVQSIRIASTLADRFGVLLGTGDSSTEQLELAIGEAQQIYPEIWNHLEDARTELIALGRDVTHYDAARREVRTMLGVTNIDSDLRFDVADFALGGFGITQTKVARFNVRGYQIARAAVRALMMAMPEIDWNAIARAEARGIAAVGTLHGSKWLGIAKGLGVVAAVAIVGVVIYKLASSAPTDEDVARDERAEAQTKIDREIAALREAKLARKHHIHALRERYDTTCDRALLPELVKALRDDRQPSTATRLETEPCVRQRPSCESVRDAIAVRVAAQLELVRDSEWTLHCVGMLVGSEPKLAIAVTGRGKDRTLRSLHGVTSADGTHDDVAFVATAEPRLLGAADLDGVPGDELVFVGTTTLVATRVEAGAFVDHPGPVLPAGCSGDATLEGDFRDGRKGERMVLVISVPDEAPRKGCLAPGRHYFGLVAGKLVEAN